MQDFTFQDILFSLQETNSTNTQAKLKIDQNEGGNIFCITAKTQTMGRGRMERTWHSEKGNIYFTLAVEEKFIPSHLLAILPLYTAFSIAMAINSKKVQYKWPNDLLIENKKFCGILIEKHKKFFIIGMGVNCASYPENTIFPATCLNEHNITINPEEIFESFQLNLEKDVKFIINFLTNLFFTEEIVLINKGEFSGKFKEINANGNLVLTLENGVTKEITFGDVGLL